MSFLPPASRSISRVLSAALGATFSTPAPHTGATASAPANSGATTSATTPAVSVTNSVPAATTSAPAAANEVTWERCRADAAALDLGGAPRVCIVLVDGLGFENLQARLGYAPNLRGWEHLSPLYSTIPSTTAAALTTIGTGTLPGATSMLSYALRSPRTGRSFSLLSWQDAGYEPEEWQPVPGVAELLEPAERERVAIIQDRRFANSPLTRAAWKGMRHVGADGLDARVRAARQFFMHDGGKVGVFYWSEVDHAGHGEGFASEAWTHALEELDRGLGELRRALPSGTRIAVTADHGMVDVGERIDIAAVAPLREGIAVTSGEERGVHVYAEPGVDPAAIAMRWRDYLGEDAAVFTKAEAIAQGLYGPQVTEFSRQVLGDVISYQYGDLSLIDSRTRTPGQSFMRGVHGSVTEQEMLVPWIMSEA
ncbi:Type I phosphodiesterase / nucleotide pyrophosphatase [Actinobaculum suis]|uniref:Type I phosphodiesterase / nucleotide pyrophosphatase n=1 Tax=Actinobaculum suis TaxID=1657 RepID=A0A7Z9C8L5_9ACTO|nr:alkaline phosphatase family protein [Actinobaculum suis]VDG76630.1 Type I phosphodiesterase / nucleotide pyrophosphatase [Actinobaculum suis]